MKSCVAAFVIAAALAAAPQARVAKASPEARALWEKGQAAGKESKHAEAAAFYRQAIDAAPDYLDAHASYMAARWRALHARQAGRSPEEIEKESKALTEELDRLYQGWVRQQPDRAAYHWGLGSNAAGIAAEKHFQTAVRLDPQCAPAWGELSVLAEKRGDNARSLQYLRKAVDSDPDDPRILRSYASKFRDSDLSRYRKLEMEVVNRWPQSEEAAYALYTLGTTFGDKKEAVTYWERLLAAFPPEKGIQSRNAAASLFRAYLQNAPEKALALARDMAKKLVKDEDTKRWRENAAFAGTFIEGRNLLQAARFAEARAVLDQAKPPQGIDLTSLNLMKAKATAGAGETAKAYDELAKLAAIAPNETLEKHLRKLGARLDKAGRQVDDDLWKIRDAAASPAKELNLPQYGEEARKVNLADYRGRVVLLSFFFPG